MKKGLIKVLCWVIAIAVVIIVILGVSAARRVRNDIIDHGRSMIEYEIHVG